jgi:squalene-hopene/tetraprenyl-beta-curcumene cyclase
MSDRLEAAYQKALAALLAERHPDGYWVGELSTSALSTATAVMALHCAKPQAAALIEGGLSWLAAHQNDDGGWGDTIKSFSNISTTMLCRAAYRLTGAGPRFQSTLDRADRWMTERYGTTAEAHAEAVRQRYGKDRTFAVPILTTCALAGMVSWNEVPSLPFELACFPQWMFRFFRLHVVSYALPALIAIGQCIYHHRKPWNPFARVVRWLARRRSLRVLQRIQPSNGGFLEATPLTSFVTLSLASIGLADHPVTRKGVEFIERSVLSDGSWPIDTNLSTWVTTLAINALGGADGLKELNSLQEVQSWLTKQQYQTRHPYTGADPGGWAWTPLPGGVPDADDTPGALLALAKLHEQGSPAEFDTAWAGANWLLGLQNRDSGWPTFCRGWGYLPFDRSGVDLTAHVLRAFSGWEKLLRGSGANDWETYRGWADELWSVRSVKRELAHKQRFLQRAISEGLVHLSTFQRPDGSWLPLWFGNQHATDDINPTYGTARVLAAYRDLGMMDSEPAKRGVSWLLKNQNEDGGWGGIKGTPSSVEETSLAVEVLLDAPATPQAAIERGLEWLIGRVEAGGLHEPTPIGFYFAKLWYYEKLYPIIFAVAALGRARRLFTRQESGSSEMAGNIVADGKADAR